MGTLVFQGTTSVRSQQEWKGNIAKKEFGDGLNSRGPLEGSRGLGKGERRWRARWVGGDRSEMAAVGHGIVLTARGGIDSTDHCRRPGTSHSAVCGIGGGEGRTRISVTSVGLY